MKTRLVEVGMFKLPGVVITDDEDKSIDEETLNQMDLWASSEQGTGQRLTDQLWSFKTVAQRDWFLLRWSS